MPDTSAPFAFVADIIIENGKVRLLELGDLHSSGLEGFDAIHGGDLHTEVTRFTQNLRPDTSRNYNATLQACCDDKGFFYALFADACPKLFPQTRIYPFYKLEDQLNDIAHDFAAHENIVFKAPEEAQGNGIHMRATQDIALRPDADLIDTFSLPDQNPLNPTTSVSVFARACARSIPSHFVVQSLSKADPLTIDNKQFAPVMRVVMVVNPNDDGTLTLHHKGAYFKLPPTALDDTDNLHDKYISKISGFGQGAAPVPDALYKSVQKQLDTHFKPALENAYFTPTTRHIETLLKSGDQGKTLVALNWFTHHTHLQLNADEDLTTIIPRIDTILTYTPPALRFMAARANARQSWHRKLSDEKDRYKDLSTETYDGTCALSTNYLLRI